MKKIGLLITIILLPILLMAQQDSSLINNNKKSFNFKVDNTPLANPDSNRVFVLYADQPNEMIEILDTALYNGYQIYNPIYESKVDGVNLGNLGGPTRSLIFQPQTRMGLDAGYQQFNLYQLEDDKIRFFKSEKTFTNLYYSQFFDSQEDFILKALLTRKVSKRMYFGLDYQRINHQGSYKHQKAKHTTLGLSNWYQNKKKNYTVLGSYNYQEFLNEDNGGITADSFFTDANFDTRRNIPVHLEEAFTEHDKHSFQLTQHFSFFKKDTIDDSANRRFNFSHHLNYNTNYYKYLDDGADTSFYGDFYTDTRGLRTYLTVKTFENKVNLSTFKPKKTGNNYVQRDLLTVGLVHRYQEVNQEPNDTSFQSLFLTGKFQLLPNDGFKLKADAYFGLLGYIGDYRIRANMELSLGKLGVFKAGLLSQLLSPTLIENQLSVTKVQIWQNDFNKRLTTSLNAAYEIPEWQFEVEAQYHLLDNYIFYDSLAMPQQSNSAISVLSLIVRKDFKFGEQFGLANTFALQETDNNVIRLPNFWAKHSFYYQDRWFKNRMEAQLGLDLRYHSDYKAYEYMPLTGQFYLQDDTNISLYPLVDVYIGFKIQQFRFYFKAENLTDLLTTDIYYETPNRPMTDLRFRMGIRWQFLDN